MGSIEGALGDPSVNMSPEDPLQPSGHVKVHTPNCRAEVEFSGAAPQVRRAAAERGRQAASAYTSDRHAC